MQTDQTTLQSTTVMARLWWPSFIYSLWLKLALNKHWPIWSHELNVPLLPRLHFMVIKKRQECKHLLDLSRTHSEEDFSHCEGRSVLSSKQSDGAPVSKSSQTYIGISAWQVFAINYALL